MHSVLEENDNGNGNMFPFPSFLVMETETRFRFCHSLKWKQRRVFVSIYDKFPLNLCSWLEMKACFRFHHSLKWNGKLFPFPVCHLFVINYGARVPHFGIFYISDGTINHPIGTLSLPPSIAIPPCPHPFQRPTPSSSSCHHLPTTYLPSSSAVCPPPPALPTTPAK